jgi:Diguanylate cyclase, GGDEF domain
MPHLNRIAIPLVEGSSNAGRSPQGAGWCPCSGHAAGRFVLMVSPPVIGRLADLVGQDEAKCPKSEQLHDNSGPMDLIYLFIELMEPRAVLGVGIIIAFGISGFLAVQAKMSTGYRWLFSVLSLSVSLAGTSLFASLILFEDLTFRYTLFVRLIGTTSYLLGMYSLVLLYRPAFPRSIFVLFALLSLSGYALWTSPGAARNWNMVCQFAIAVFTLAVVTRARDDLAPNTRWLSICLCLFSACGLLPSLFAMLATGMDPGPGPISLDSPMRRVAILFWAVSPMAVYAVVTGVIHARIASKLKRAIDLDVLTGAYSRRYLFERGEQLLKHRTTEAPPSLGVMLIDVDHFKQVNDQWGHAIGDEV